MVILNKDVKYSNDEIIFLNKFLSDSEDDSLFLLLNRAEHKVNVLDNCDGNMEDLPKGYVLKVSRKDDKMILTNIQHKEPLDTSKIYSRYKTNIKLDTT